MKKRILVAEDSREWQKFHASLLNNYKEKEDTPRFEYRIASSAREALEILKNNGHFDLIFSDLQMETEFLPELAGEWLVKEIKQIPGYQNAKIVLVSATYNIGFIASRLGVDYLSKRSLINYPEAYYSILDEKLK